MQNSGYLRNRQPHAGANPYIPAMNSQNYLQRRVRSFGFAFRGIAILFFSQAHAKIHLVATILAIVLGILVQLELVEWGLLSLAITIVWVAEGMNTAIEFVVDLASPDHHVLAGKAKDVAAGAVLLASFGAIAVAGCLFVPKIWHLI
jgi:diacylglycerol kinase